MIQILLPPHTLYANNASLSILDPEKRLPIRMSYSAEKCTTFFCPQDFDTQTGKMIINESVGIPIANGDIGSFELALQNILSRTEKENFRGIIYIAGVDIHSEELLRQNNQEILYRLGLQEQIQIKIISMPKEKINDLTIRSAKVFIDRVIHWFPSLKRDFESPHSNEVIAALASTALIETGTVYYLFNTLPTTDALLTVTFHTVLLCAYAVYTKFIMNWLLRPGSNTVEAFLKQLSITLPFVLNFNIFGQYTPLVEFLKTHSVQQTMAAFPKEAIEFASTQSVTMLLQTLFYYVVITKVIGDWANKQKGVTKNSEARVYRKISEMPILGIDAIVLAIASGAGANTLLSMGPLEVYDGHAMLLMLTVLGAGVYKLGLDPSFKFYSWITKRISPSVLDYFRDSLGIDLRYATSRLKNHCQSLLGK